MNTPTTQADQLIAALKAYKREEAKRNKLSDRFAAMTLVNSTDRARGGLREKLNWQCMEVRKREIDVARLFENGAFDVGTETRTFRPSGFHEFQY